MNKKSYYIFLLIFFLHSVAINAQEPSSDSISLDLDFDAAFEQNDLLPMPEASQTNTIPEVSFDSVQQPEESLISPVDSELAAQNDTTKILQDTSQSLDQTNSLYFDSITKDAELRDDDIPRRVNPGVEVGSKFIVVQKNSAANSHNAMLVSANRALALGRYSSALELFETLHRKNSRDTNILMGLAVAQQKSGFVESAISSYEDLLEIDPNNIEANINMLGLVKRKFPSVAYRRLVDLWEKNPDSSGLAAQIGLVSAELGNSDDAIHYLGIAASLEPNNANHFYNMAVVSDSSGDKKQAVNYYERALEIDAVHGSNRSVPRDTIYDRLSVLRRL